MSKTDFLHIIHKYRSGTASKKERRLVEAYYRLLGLREGMDKELLDDKLEEKILNKVWKEIYSTEKEAKKKKMMLVFSRIAAAVMVLIALGVTIYALNKDFSSVSPQEITSHKADSSKIEPASKVAVLTLANGQQVRLGSGKNLNLKGVARQDSSSLIYNGKKIATKEIKYNTLTTPRGGEFNIVLSDGTKVWMNAGSSLRYPISFSEKNRTVSLEGEAYFEVAQQKNKPFKVKVGESEIQVLGTHFNIRAYDGMESMKTTLAEGKVRVVKATEKQLLIPGEQAVFENGKIAVLKANMDKVLAWKNDLFYFEDTNIKEIMNELSRWYDVDVAYRSKQLGKMKFSGIISRYADIKEVLKRFSLTGTVHFDIEGRTVVVE